MEVEIRKNMWRSYRVEGKVVKLDDYFIKSKRSKEKEEEIRRKKKKAQLLEDSWKSMKALLKDLEENGEEWKDDEEEPPIEKEEEEQVMKENRNKRKREEEEIPDEECIGMIMKKNKLDDLEVKRVISTENGGKIEVKMTSRQTSVVESVQILKNVQIIVWPKSEVGDYVRM